jgi:hypothetical protein
MDAAQNMAWQSSDRAVAEATAQIVTRLSSAMTPAISLNDRGHRNLESFFYLDSHGAQNTPLMIP